MLVSIFSPKGGSGATTVAALCAKSLSSHRSTLLIDACQGDMFAALGIDEPPRFTFTNWAYSDHPTAESLARIAVGADVNLDVVLDGELGEGDETQNEAGVQDSLFAVERNNQDIVSGLRSLETHCVVDLGTRRDDLAASIIEASDVVLMVARECYLSLWRATHHQFLSHVDAAVIVHEAGRSISTSQFVDALSLTTIIELEARRDYARVIDAGVILFRTPKNLLAPIDAFFADVLYAESSIDRADLFEDAHERNKREFWTEQPRPQSRRKKSSLPFDGSRSYATHVKAKLGVR